MENSKLHQDCPVYSWSLYLNLYVVKHTYRLNRTDKKEDNRKTITRG